MTRAARDRPRQSPDAVEVVDLVVVGAGVAGLSAALASPDLEVRLITRGELGRSGASPLAKGGIAAAVGAGDSPLDHAADTEAAAAGLADPEIVRLLTREGPTEIARLLTLGARFDRDPEGRLALGREAAHGRHRILHAGGDATGAEVVRALVAAARARTGLEVEERTEVLDLVIEHGRVAGVATRSEDGRIKLLLSHATVLATGGLGAAHARTTNPPESIGEGLAMAARAGARLADLEFVQFHPTALDVGADPMPLLTEALRGAGATLVDDAGRRFLKEVHPSAELAPRDVVTRGIWRLHQDGGRAYLDATSLGTELFERYPAAAAACRAHGLDLGAAPVPVSPAAHYHMGGIAVDSRGRSSLAGLWACGEVARTGAHGANRLASNSLLEGLVFGARVGADIARRVADLGPRPVRVETVEDAANQIPAERAVELRAAIRRTLWNDVGVVRDRDGLERAARLFKELERSDSGRHRSIRNLVTVAQLVTAAALAREESRGGHFRTDFPNPDPRHRVSLSLRLDPASGALAIERIPIRSTPTHRKTAS